VPHARDDRRDRGLLCDLASGRREALGELYDRHAASLFRHAVALTRRSADAEDLVQSVFVKLATTGAELLAVRKPASYLHRILSTTWLDSQRRTIAGERAVEISTMNAVEPHPFGLEGSIDIGRALDGLPDAQREAVVLHVFDGFSFREVGRATGVSIFTAAARYRLAIARLRKTLARVPEETR
jgi:RNA polymerase sigma-70 factor (ECF subfamily)